jgi:hypothetical protein
MVQCTVVGACETVPPLGLISTNTCTVPQVPTIVHLTISLLAESPRLRGPLGTTAWGLQALPFP